MTATLTRHETGAVTVRALPNSAGQPTGWIALSTDDGGSFLLEASEVITALELSGSPLHGRMPACEIAQLVVVGLQRAGGLGQVQQLDRRTRAAAGRGLATGEWADYDRLMRGRVRLRSRAVLQALRLFDYANQQAGAA